jgi:F420-non-reducing hydrogenase small subunit
VKEGELKIPEFYDTVRTLAQTVDVDYFLPGCPPPVKLIAGALDAIARNDLPPKGSVLAPMKAVCDECPRKRENKKIGTIYRVHEKTPEPERCLMEQGIVCMGMATRGGCGAQCLTVDMPCTGCGGVTPNMPEQGAAMITALASILGHETLEGKETYTEKEIEDIISQVKDPVGTFYMFSLPSSIMKRKVKKQ